MLTYRVTKVVQAEKKETQDVPLTTLAEREWSMFTTAGNKSITKKALILIAKLEKSKTLTQKINALNAFLRSYRRMGLTKTMGEASDTAVRECVGYFFDKACGAVGIGSSTADEIWDSPDSGY